MNFHQRDADSRTMLTVLTVLLVFLGVVSILGLTADSLLSQRRIYAELKEVISEGLTLDVPFNSSADEVCHHHLKAAPVISVSYISLYIFSVVCDSHQ
jgi:hypothetical protein